jgi:hypothetical protein
MFTWDKLDVVEITLPTSVAYSRPLRPEVVTFTGLLEKNKHKWWVTKPPLLAPISHH